MPFNQINVLRKHTNSEISLNNSNRYTIIVSEKTSKSAYCFSVPIYNNKSGSLVSKNFEARDDAFVFAGSNSQVTVKENTIILANGEGSIMLDLDVDKFTERGGHLIAEKYHIIPTFNGIQVDIDLPTADFQLRLDKAYSEARLNSKCFAIMQEQFKPFVTITTLPTLSIKEKALPTEITVDAVNEKLYNAKVNSKEGGLISFEINLYEPKIIQDTTVESNHAEENNAYGGIAFLGNTPWYGDQWLYMRVDFSKLPLPQTAQIESFILHMPCYYNRQKRLFAHIPVSRFCSFGSTWENKKDIGTVLVFSYRNGDYTSLDLTGVINNDLLGFMQYGLAINCSPIKDSYTVVSTGDCYSKPVIIEIKYH